MLVRTSAWVRLDRKFTMWCTTGVELGRAKWWSREAGMQVLLWWVSWCTTVVRWLPDLDLVLAVVGVVLGVGVMALVVVVRLVVGALRLSVGLDAGLGLLNGNEGRIMLFGSPVLGPGLFSNPL